MSRSPYGKRGGTSVNAGRRATRYRATLPDGTVAVKRSYRVSAATAWLVCYEHEGRWWANTITDNPSNWPGQRCVPAERIQEHAD